MEERSKSNNISNHNNISMDENDGKFSHQMHLKDYSSFSYVSLNWHFKNLFLS